MADDLSRFVYISCQPFLGLLILPEPAVLLVSVGDKAVNESVTAPGIGDTLAVAASKVSTRASFQI